MNIERFVSTLRRLHRRIFRRRENEHIRQRVEALRAASIFSDLRSSHLGVIAEVMHERTFVKDEVIYYEGDPGLGLYIIRQGSVRLTRRDEKDEDVEITELGESDVFGVLSAFEDLRRFESARSMADTILYGLFRPDLASITNRNPAAAASAYRVLGRHVGRLHSSMLDRVQERYGRMSSLEILSHAVES